MKIKVENWMIIVSFLYFISSAISLYVPLRILQLGGNSFDVVTSITGYTLAGVLFSLVAGELTQKRAEPRYWILLSILLTIVAEISMLIWNTILALMIEYWLVNVFLTLGSPSVNLYIMRREKGLFSRFGSYSLLGIAGSIIAYLIGSTSIDLVPYLLITIAITLLALLMAVFLLPAFKFSMKEKREHKKHFALLISLSYLPYLLTSVRAIKHLHAINRKELEFSLLMYSIMLYTAGIYIFGSPYIPYLNRHGLSNAQIFWIYLLGSLGNIIVYLIYAVGFRLNSMFSYKLSLFFRILGYLPIGIAALLSIYTFPTNIFGYFMLGLSYSFWNVGASVEVFKLIRKMDAARKSGIWAALTGTVAAIASEVSSPIYSLLGFAGNVLIAGALIFSSYAFFRKAENLA